jgi:hypothetical protein
VFQAVNQQGGRFAAASVEPGMPAGEFTLELVPGLLVLPLFAAEPVVLLEPDIALFIFTAPLASLQWVAAETPDGAAAPGVVVAGGGELVWAPATRTLDTRTSAAPRSFFDMMVFPPEVAVAHPERTSELLIARPVTTGAVVSGCKEKVAAMPRIRLSGTGHYSAAAGSWSGSCGSASLSVLCDVAPWADAFNRCRSTTRSQKHSRGTEYIRSAVEYFVRNDMMMSAPSAE